MKNKKIYYGIVLTAALIISVINPTNIPTEAAKIKLNKASITLDIGKTFTLKVKGIKKKAKWVSSNKKIATVTQKGKVTAKSAGTAKITAKIAKKKYSCTVKVTDLDTASPTPVSTTAPTQEPTPSAAPTQQPTAAPTQEPPEPTGTTVSDNFEKLKTYIQSNGSVDESGYQSIKYTYSGGEYRIGFAETEAEIEEGKIERIPVFMFHYVFESDSLWGVSMMGLTPSLSTSTVSCNAALYLQTVENDNILCYSVGTSIDPKTYTENTMLTFEIKDNPMEIDDATIQAGENQRLSNAFVGWEIFLNKEVGLNWADLGFTAY